MSATAGSVKRRLSDADHSRIEQLAGKGLHASAIAREIGHHPSAPLSTEPVSVPVPVLKHMTKEEATEFFSVLFLGEHHIPGDVKPFGRGWKVNAYSGWLSTYDYDNLTRLVFLAHDRCVRVEINQGGPGRVGIAIWKRHGRNGDTYSRHPTIKAALVNWRMKHPAPTDGCEEHGGER